MAIYTSHTYYDCIAAAAKKAASFGNRPDVKTLLFCEDKLTLSLELAVAKETGGTFAAEVSSFGRFARKYGGAKNVIGKEGSAMIVRKIFSAQANNLRVFDPTANSPALSSATAELIAQLKSVKVTPDDLTGCLDECPKNIAAKIADISLIYAEYENYLKINSFADSNNALAALPALLRSLPDLRETHVLVVGYSSVTRQSCDVLSALRLLSATCDFFAVAGENEEIYTNEFLNFVRRIDQSEPIRTPSSETAEAVRLREGLFQPSAFAKDGLYSDKVTIYQAKNLTDECEFVARRIRYEVITHGMRYRDFAISAGDLATYSPMIKKACADLSVPCFIDEKRKLSEHPLSRLADDLLRLCRNKDVAIVKRVLQNSAFLPSKAVADDFLFRLTEGSVSGKTFFDNEKPLAGEPDLTLSAVRDRLISMTEKLSRAKTTKDFCTVFREFLSDGIADNVGEISAKLEAFGENAERSFNDQAIGKFTDLLTEAENILGNEQMNADSFRRLLAVGAEACETSILPESADGVYCSEIKNVRFRRYKILFAVGLGSDVPAVKGDTALLLDSDIGKLDSLNVSVEPKIRVVNRREQEATTLALLSFSDRLFLSYSLLSPSGKQAAKSRIIDYAEAIFSDAKKKLRPVDALSLEKAARDYPPRLKDAAESLRYLAMRPALFSLLSDGDDFLSGAKTELTAASSFYRALEGSGNDEAILFADSLLGRLDRTPPVRKNIPPSNYFSGGRVSASILETYYSCPYKNYAKYGVGLRDSLTGEIRALDFGNVLHAVAEKFVSMLESTDSEDSARAAADKIFEEVLAEGVYQRFLQHPDYAYSAMLVKKECEKICVDLYLEFSQSGFKPIGEEVWFADWGGKYRAIPFRTKKGVFKLSGKADRLDRFGNHIRIVDYKTGNAAEKVKDEKFYTGNNLQLYLYLNAFAVNGDKPAGAYYYGLNDNFTKEGETLPLMTGKTLDDEKILAATDAGLSENKKSRYVDVKIRSFKSGDKISGNVADERTMEGYMKYAMKIAGRGTEQIADGTIIPSPYKNACEYCEYGGLCLYDEETDNRTREVKSVTAEIIVQAGERNESISSGDPAPKEKQTGNGKEEEKE